MKTKFKLTTTKVPILSTINFKSNKAQHTMKANITLMKLAGEAWKGGAKEMLVMSLFKNSCFIRPGGRRFPTAVSSLLIQEAILVVQEGKEGRKGLK